MKEEAPFCILLYMAVVLKLNIFLFNMLLIYTLLFCTVNQKMLSKKSKKGSFWKLWLQKVKVKKFPV